MDKTIQYVCPIDNDVVLFEETAGQRGREIEMIRPERPEQCRKCTKHYYKHECVRKESD
jgi:hypothetical protein